MFKKFFSKLNVVLVGGLSVFIFFVLGFIWWIFDANTQVPMWLLSVVIILCYIVCIIVYGVCSTEKGDSLYRMPMVKCIHKRQDKLILIVENNELFRQGSLATICYQEDEKGLEIVLGLGYVQTFTTAGYLQIGLIRVINDESVQEVYKKLEDTKFYRKAIKVKPSVYNELIGEDLLNG